MVIRARPSSTQSRSESIESMDSGSLIDKEFTWICHRRGSGRLKLSKHDDAAYNWEDRIPQLLARARHEDRTGVNLGVL